MRILVINFTSRPLYPAKNPGTCWISGWNVSALVVLWHNDFGTLASNESALHLMVHKWTVKKDGHNRYCNPQVRAGLTGITVKQLPGAPNYKRRYDVTEIMSNLMLLNSGFHKRIICSKIIRNLGMRPQNFRQPSPRSKKVKRTPF